MNGNYFQEVKGTMKSILTKQNKQLLAHELAKLMLKYSTDLDLGWNIKDIDLSFIYKQRDN